MVDLFYSPREPAAAAELPVPVAPPLALPVQAVPAMEPAQPEAASPTRRRRRWPWVVGFAVIVGLIIALVQLANSPAQGVTLSTAQTKVSASTTAPAVSWVGLDGRYLGFSYPDNLSARVTSEPGSLESYLFYANDRSGWQLAAEALSGSLASNSSVQFRRAHKDQYSEESAQANGVNFVVFTKNGEGWEKSAFAQKGSVIASLVVSDPGGVEHDNDFIKILESFRLK